MYIPLKKYQNLNQSLRHIPEYLLHTRASCNQCGLSFNPDWLKKKPPLVPVTPYSGNGKWIPVAAILRCPTCNSDVEFSLPFEEQKARYGFFGDEAYRDVDDKYALTYSLVGTNHVRLPEIEERVRDFKKRIDPTVSPDNWVLHMKDMWPSDAQRRHPVFKSWSRESMVELSKDLFALIRSFDEAFLVFNVSAVFYKSGGRKQLDLAKKEVRHEAYTLLLMEIIDNSTRYGVMPYFVFDSEKDSCADKIIHQWASDAFHGSQLNLVYSCVARGIEIPEPIFVKPASRPCLELADFVSYVVARYIHRRLKRQPVDLDPKELGNVTYLGFDTTGNMRRAYVAGYPWKQFFGNA